MAPALTSRETNTNYCTIPVLKAVLVPLSWLFVLLRLWTRAKINQSLGWDDVAAVVTVVFVTVDGVSGSIITARMSPKNGAISQQDVLVANQLLLVSEVFYSFSVMALKISVGILYLRVAIKKWHRNIIYLVVSLSTIWGVVAILFIIFECGVFHNIAVYMARQFEGKCASRSAELAVPYTQAAVITLTDWVFILLPVALLRNTFIKPKEKYIVIGILMFSSIGSIASIIRFRYLDTARFSPDVIQNSTELSIWSSAEINAGVIASSVVTLRPLLNRCFSKMEVTGSTGQKPNRPWREQLRLAFRMSSRRKLCEPSSEMEDGLKPSVHQSTAGHESDQMSVDDRMDKALPGLPSHL